MSELPAGRELDALIAEKVMGRAVAGRATAVYVDGEWSIHPDTEPDGWSCYAAKEPLMVREDCRCGRGPLRVEACEGIWTEAQAAAENERWRAKYEEEMARFGHEVACLRVVPEYSTDIRAALQVLEHMSPAKRVGQAYLPCITLNAPVAEGQWPDDVPLGRWSVEWFDGVQTLSCEDAETAPLAICRAALKAVGI